MLLLLGADMRKMWPSETVFNRRHNNAVRMAVVRNAQSSEQVNATCLQNAERQAAARQA